MHFFVLVIPKIIIIIIFFLGQNTFVDLNIWPVWTFFRYRNAYNGFGEYGQENVHIWRKTIVFLSAEAVKWTTLHLKYSSGQNNGAQRLLSNCTPVSYKKTKVVCVIRVNTDYNCIS